MRKFLKRLFCHHLYMFERNIYGDEINDANARSWWVCVRCGKWQGRPNLFKDDTERESNPLP